MQNSKPTSSNAVAVRKLKKVASVPKKNILDKSQPTSSNVVAVRKLKKMAPVPKKNMVVTFQEVISQQPVLPQVSDVIDPGKIKLKRKRHDKRLSIDFKKAKIPLFTNKITLLEEELKATDPSDVSNLTRIQRQIKHVSHQLRQIIESIPTE